MLMHPEEEEHLGEQFSHLHHRLTLSFFIQCFDGLWGSIELQAGELEGKLPSS